MKQARAPFPQIGNNLWRAVQPRRSKGPCPVRRARSWPSSWVPSPDGTLVAAERLPRRGGGREATLQANRPAQAGREASVGSDKGAKAPGGAGFFNRRIHELATEGARATRIGVSASHQRDPHRSTS